MPENLVFNPYTQIQMGHGSELFVSAPKLGDSLRTLDVSVAEHRNLFEVFTEFAQINLSFIDIRNDLSATERELLYENGILVEKGCEPELPLFACQLDEVAPFLGEIDNNSLIVNPGFRFEPFDLTKFAALVSEQHLSPHQSKAWVISPITETAHHTVPAPTPTHTLITVNTTKKSSSASQ